MADETSPDNEESYRVISRGPAKRDEVISTGLARKLDIAEDTTEIGVSVTYADYTQGMEEIFGDRPYSHEVHVHSFISRLTPPEIREIEAVAEEKGITGIYLDGRGLQ
ncbi:hypothetical protein GF386_02795 [Candidatus Pacearchaeota archaeon]|nr:hypothetical protein [Candidatus Pacearchaeota archaeon]MBD3283076.1 hypothetical protein [Candidatus Pacearchaeota archaeon]